MIRELLQLSRNRNGGVLDYPPYSLVTTINVFLL